MKTEVIPHIDAFAHLDRSQHSTMTKNDKLGYFVKHVKITTCGQLYQQWKTKRKLYQIAPPNGLTINVEYADTKGIESVNNNDDKEVGQSAERTHVPVVLALHGAPGSHQDFAPLIKHLSRNGARVIAPNFPDYSLTVKTEVWRHSGEEKAEYIKEFLKAIGVNKIDMLLSHSSAIYPSLILWSDASGPDVKSIALFNPAGHRRIKSMKPVWYIEGSVKIYENKLGRTIFKNFGTAFLNITKSVPVRADNMHNVILSASTMMYSGYRKLEEKLIALKNAQIPLLFVYSENDRLIEKEIFCEMIEIIGAEDDDVTKFDEHCSLEKLGTSNDRIKVLAFQSGGHYAFLKYTKQINNACSELLEKSLNYQKSASIPANDTMISNG